MALAHRYRLQVGDEIRPLAGVGHARTHHTGTRQRSHGVFQPGVHHLRRPDEPGRLQGVGIVLETLLLPRNLAEDTVQVGAIPVARRGIGKTQRSCVWPN